MNASLYTGVLGLKNHQLKMDVIGNNIANVNTYGFKMGRATFADLLSRMYQGAASPRDGRGGINPLQIGTGMTTIATTNIMTQGQVETTGRLTDMALDGNGFFILQDDTGRKVYTRDGAFNLDKDGTLVSANGWKVQGWTTVKTNDDYDFIVDTARPVTDIDFRYGDKLEAQATNKVSFKSNLKADSRALISDGVDAKSSWGLNTDTLIDMYDNNSITPKHLGLREGDWIEVHANVAYKDYTPSGSQTGSTPSAPATSATVYGLIPTSALPLKSSSEVVVVAGTAYSKVDSGPTGNQYTFNSTTGTITTGTGSAGTAFYNDGQGGTIQSLAFTSGTAAAGLVGKDVIAVNVGGTTYTRDADGTIAATEYSIDNSTGAITFNSAVPASSSLQVGYVSQLAQRSSMPYYADKYLYFQVTNDTTVGDLQKSIQNAIDAVDINGTLNASVGFQDGKFIVYNNSLSGSGDYNDVKVDINAASGSAIRRGFLLKDSTSPTLTGTRLGIVDGGLGNLGTREQIGTVDYQVKQAVLDYGNIDGSAQIFAKLVQNKLVHNYTNTATTSLASASFTGTPVEAGTGGIVPNSQTLTVNGVVWRAVSSFSSSGFNEYMFDSTTGTVTFSSTAAQRPAANSKIILTYRPVGAQAADATALTLGTDYTIDATTGNISLLWKTGADTATKTDDDTLGGRTGVFQLSSQYTTEERRMAPPHEVMNSRWADFVQELAPVSNGGTGRGRTDFNNMFSSINQSASSGGLIGDQATSTQPTSKQSTLLQSAATHRTSIDTYDSLGDVHNMRVVFTHVGSSYDPTNAVRYTNRWYWRTEIPYEDAFAFDSLDLLDAGSSFSSSRGQIEFKNSGLVDTTKLGGQSGPVAFDPSPIDISGASTHAAKLMNVNLDFDGKGNPVDGITQYASDFTTAAYEQNGYAMGTLETFSTDQTGILNGRYSNNIVKPLAQIALAVFPNEEGLNKDGNNLFSQSANSGYATVNPAYVNGAGFVHGASLEQSNVDLAQEFTNMIITQRGFQANSRVVTTSDEMLTELLNLKR